MSLVATFAGMATSLRADDRPVTIADLAGYREALDEKPSGAPVVVGFHELWKNPRDFRGRQVQVQGRVARVFHQPAFGTFPPLAEMWTVSTAGNFFCLVFADPADRPPPHVNDEVVFVGTFLRLIPYEARDTRRLAPLIVGNTPPRVALHRPSNADSATHLTIDWVVGLALAGIVVGFLLTRHLRRPAPRRTEVEKLDRPPMFIDDP